IRDFHVTGVQTCALPISGSPRSVPAASAAAPCRPSFPDSPVVHRAVEKTVHRQVRPRVGMPLRELFVELHAQTGIVAGVQESAEIGRASWRGGERVWGGV